MRKVPSSIHESACSPGLELTTISLGMMQITCRRVDASGHPIVGRSLRLVTSTAAPILRLDVSIGHLIDVAPRRESNTSVTLDTMAPGAHSEEAWLWHTTVCEAIQEIPSGKVTSYAHIARLVGKRERPKRMIVTQSQTLTCSVVAQCPR